MLQTAVIDAVRARRAAVGRHHFSLTARGQDVLVLEALGFEAIEIARMLGTSANTVRHQIHRARADAVPPQLAPTRANSTLSVLLHMHCCTATAFASVGMSGRERDRTTRAVEPSTCRLPVAKPQQRDQLLLRWMEPDGRWLCYWWCLRSDKERKCRRPEWRGTNHCLGHALAIQPVAMGPAWVDPMVKRGAIHNDAGEKLSVRHYNSRLVGRSAADWLVPLLHRSV